MAVVLVACAAFFGMVWWSWDMPGIAGLLVLGSAPAVAAAATGLGAKSLEWWTWRGTRR